MAQKYGFFNSVSGDRSYDASDIARFLAKYFTNGIFNNSLQVVSNDNMTVTVKTGSANINGYSYELDSELTFDITEADTTLSRIDSVVLRLDLTNRQITLMILNGSYATNPSQPSIVRSGNIYDLRLANISVPKNETRITADLINDTRFGDDCGNVTQAVLSLDTEDIFKQYQTMFDTWFTEIKDKLSTDQAGNLQNEINEIRESLGLYTDTYNTSSIYNKGDLVIYDHKIYTCLENNITGNWDNSKWSLSPVVNPNDISVILPYEVVEEWEETV